ncbi:trypsin-like peptidase domain-containing protein [Streptomyces sp. NPDC059696]|uniref:trypsin-like peptidase domain-containing protein n=1 Tax=Streptomyces sp. NPDC059696 TaxID=3346911 RepID=UPI0036828C9D
MNEGKPTKAKWWSRPRPQEHTAEPQGADPRVGKGQGVAEDQAVTEGSAAAGQGAERLRAGEPARLDRTGGSDADFELPRPAPPSGGDSDGDYELRHPEAVPTVAESDSAEPAHGVAGTDDVVVGGAGEAVAPVSAESAHGVAGTDDVVVGGAGEAVAPVSAESAHGVAGTDDVLTGGAAQGLASVPAARSSEQGLPVAAAAPAAPSEEAPKPLHDPDPYSTPPYGEPGPWAPAPPVQHPATSATPAQGVAMPGQAAVPSAQGTPPTPVPGAPAPAVHPTAAHGPAEPPPPATPAPAPAAPPYADAPATAPASGPWQRYDPWAAPTVAQGQGPLQQNGAAMLSTEQRRSRGRRSLVLGAVLLAVVSGGIGGAVGTYLERNGGVGTVELPQAGKESTARNADSVAGIAGRALPSVVTLHVSGADEQGTGTGFVLDTRGHILTNNHVVQPAGSGGEITVTFNGGQTAKAEVIGRDSGYDLAVVKVKGVSGLTPLPLGNSDNVQVGDPVVAIGAPFDLAGTVTSGIISAKERPITAGGEKGDGSDVSYVDALQTDAPINPGNSGGPLLDARARVIGINSAIRSAESGGSGPDSGRAGSIGLGFAIPINQGKRVAEELINTGKATHPVIGITLDMDYTGDGARVAAEGSEGGAPVTAGGPGAKAGIKAGDVIREVDGLRVHSGEELIVKTRAHRPGDRLELTVERGGKERKVSLVLGSSGG